MVDGPVAGDAEDPCLQAALRVVAPAVPPDLDEHVLHDVVDIVGLHVPPGVAAEQGAEPGDAFGARPVVARGQPPPDLLPSGVVHRGLLPPAPPRLAAPPRM